MSGETETVEYAKVDVNGKFTDWTATESEGTVLKSGSDGKFKVIGLDSGTYYLRETKAPENYNKLENDVEVVVTPAMNTEGNWTYVRNNGSTALTDLAATYDGKAATADEATGVVSGTIVNSKGIKLPETGGIGTKIFYVGGGALAIAAGVLLVTKKRAKSE